MVTGFLPSFSLDHVFFHFTGINVVFHGFTGFYRVDPLIHRFYFNYRLIRPVVPLLGFARLSNLSRLHTEFSLIFS